MSQMTDNSQANQGTKTTLHDIKMKLPVNSRSGGPFKPSQVSFETSGNLQITCEFTIGWAFQPISSKLQEVIFGLPVNSRSGGPLNTSQVNLKTSGNLLQITCEFTIGWPIPLILGTLQ